MNSCDQYSEFLSLETKVPYLLECAHRFCMSCVDDFNSNHQTKVCPKCLLTTGPVGSDT